MIKPNNYRPRLIIPADGYQLKPRDHGSILSNLGKVLPVTISLADDLPPGFRVTFVNEAAQAFIVRVPDATGLTSLMYVDASAPGTGVVEVASSTLGARLEVVKGHTDFFGVENAGYAASGG